MVYKPIPRNDVSVKKITISVVDENPYFVVFQGNLAFHMLIKKLIKNK